MLGSRRAVPLWRRRKPKFLEQERSLKSQQLKEDRSEIERGVIARIIARRRLDQAKAGSEQARHRL